MSTERFNILDKIIGKRTTDFHSAVLSCFSFDPSFFSMYYLPKLSSIGICNIVVIVDAINYESAMDQYASLLATNGGRSLGFTLVRKECEYGGVFHSKVSIFAGNKKVLAITGSGNLTYGGISLNDEVWGAFCIDSATSAQAPMVSAMWEYLRDILSKAESKLVNEQISWMLQFSEPLRSVQPANSSVIRIGDDEFSFLFNRSDKSILTQLKDIVGTTEIKRIKIVSPYYDKEGTGIIALKNAFSPQSIECYVDEKLGLTPFLLDDDSISLFRQGPSKNKSGITHAKIIQLESDDCTYVLFGSANATAAALGVGTRRNDEASILLRHEEHCDFISELGVAAGEVVRASELEHRSDKSVAKVSFPGHVFSCEKLFDHYEVRVSGIDGPHTLVYINSDGVINEALIDVGNDLLIVDCKTVQDARIIFFKNNEIQVTNKCIVFDEKEVNRCYPDPRRRELGALINAATNGHWDDNLEAILGAVVFEDDSDKESSHVSGATRQDSSKENNEGKAIDVADFDKTIYGRQSSATRSNLSILELYMSHMLRIGSDAAEDLESDDELSEEDIVTGNGGSKYTPNTENKLSPKTKLGIAGKYFKRLAEFYNHLCRNFDDADEYAVLRSENSPSHEPTLQDFSSILIAIILIIQIGRENQENTDVSVEKLLKEHFLLLVGRFVGVFCRPISSDITSEDNRVAEMKHDFILYSLAIIAHFNWSTPLVKLLVLNILEATKHDEGIIDLDMENIFDRLEKVGLSECMSSIALISRVLDDFSTFDDKKRINLDNRSTPSIIYKKRTGFLLCSGVHALANDRLVSLVVESPMFRDTSPRIIISSPSCIAL